MLPGRGEPRRGQGREQCSAEKMCEGNKGNEGRGEMRKHWRCTAKNQNCILILGSNRGILSQGQTSVPSLIDFPLLLLSLWREKGKTFLMDSPGLMCAQKMGHIHPDTLREGKCGMVWAQAAQPVGNYCRGADQLMNSQFGTWVILAGIRIHLCLLLKPVINKPSSQTPVNIVEPDNFLGSSGLSL